MEDVYVLVGNIPQFYRSSHLRIFFSQFIEGDGFGCFHFKHRPEIVRPIANAVSASEQTLSESCRADPAVSSNVAGTSVNKVLAGRGTTCCVVRLAAERIEELMRLYKDKSWLDQKGEPVKSACKLTRIRSTDTATDQRNVDSGGNLYKSQAERKCIPADREVFTQSDLFSLPELTPPPLMRRGNVGTPTRTFLRLIQRCVLPPSFISKLGLVFPRTRTNRRYGTVSLDYGGKKPRLKEAARHSSGFKLKPSKASFSLSTDPSGDAAAKDKFRYPPTTREGNDKSTAHEKDDEGDCDSDEFEEWDRYEALHDDVTSQDRTKERMYEEEQEVVWEKGGPGLVWYTDAQHWDEMEGDTEEKDTDDWDVDYEAYYDPETSDKDGRDMLTMLRDARRRCGIDTADEEMCGSMEKYSKDVGRKLLIRQGWCEGQGLGAAFQGIREPISSDGQKPSDKKGFGYRGEKLVHVGKTVTAPASRPRRTVSHLITTVYDDSEKTDPMESLLRRAPSTQLKYRQQPYPGTAAVRFEKSAEVLNPQCSAR